MSANNAKTQKCFYWPDEINSSLVKSAGHTVSASVVKTKIPDWVSRSYAVKLTRIILYPIIFISFVVVTYKTLTGELGWFVFMVFMINLLANLFFFPILVNLKNLFLANIDITIIFGTLIVQIVLVGRFSESLASMQIPQIIWVVIAMMIQFSLTYIKR